jgi:cephalosporin-C deacetylase-like acetyl esterase
LLSRGAAAPEQITNEYLEFVRAQAAALRAQEHVPTTKREWRAQKKTLRDNLEHAWGGFPSDEAPLKPAKLGELQRDGYRVEKLVFQTLPGVWMTANAYVPNRKGKLPALLMVHGHWRGAKQDPTVQARCIGAAKLGFFVLVVDAFGAGERAVGKALGEYHGDMTAATLLPVGIPLSGIQVYENMRAVDYLRTRKEVDAKQIGVTGASGGGNQSMYAGAWDERLAAAAPVCSVGNYQAYLGAACCMCEVVPGALQFTEEWQILGMVAPRALMVINATRDARQFSVDEAKKSIGRATSVFRVFEKPANVRHVTFESGHDYSQPMREAVYGWMSLHLKHQGNGSPIAEPAMVPEDPETLRCFPGESRPDNWVTIPRFAATQGERLIEKINAQRKDIDSKKSWLREKRKLRQELEKVLGGFPSQVPLQTKMEPVEGGRTYTFVPEKGIQLQAKEQGTGAGKLMIAIDLEGEKNAAGHAELEEARAAGWRVVTMSLRATGELAWSSDKVGRAPDHTTAQWGLWIGRPLLGQWVWDVRRLLDAVTEIDGKKPGDVALVGFGPGGIAALATAALDDRVTRVAALDSLASYVTDTPYEGQRLGIIVPGILKQFGDVADLAALVAPRVLLVSGGVRGSGVELGFPELRDNYVRAQNAYALLGATDRLRLQSSGAGVLRGFLAE